MSEDLREIRSPLEIGAFQQGDYTLFGQNGFRSSHGAAIAYRDEYPSQPWLPAGSNNSPDLVSHSIGGVARQLYCFSGVNTIEYLSSSFEIPHDYAYGHDIEVHAHIRPSTADAGDIKLTFNWEYSAPQGGPQQHSTQSSLSFVVSVDDQRYFNIIRAFTSALPQDEFQFELGGKIGFNVVRIAGDPADTYLADMILEQVALHIPVDTDGSRELYHK